MWVNLWREIALTLLEESTCFSVFISFSFCSVPILLSSVKQCVHAAEKPVLFSSLLKFSWLLFFSHWITSNPAILPTPCQATVNCMHMNIYRKFLKGNTCKLCFSLRIVFLHPFYPSTFCYASPTNSNRSENWSEHMVTHPPIVSFFLGISRSLLSLPQSHSLQPFVVHFLAHC